MQEILRLNLILCLHDIGGVLSHKWISSRKHLVDVLRKESVVAEAKLCNKAVTLCEITKLAKKSQIPGNVEEQEIIAGVFEFR